MMRCSSQRQWWWWKINFFRYDPLDLASADQSWTFSHGCHEEYCPCNIYSGCYVFDNGDSYSWLVSNKDKDVRLLFSSILVLILLPMVIDYFNDCTHVYSLGIAAQINIMGELSLVFIGLWFSCNRMSSVCHERRKSLKKLQDLLVSFRLYFLNIGFSSGISIWRNETVNCMINLIE
jgi:hypothetical protein